MPEKFDLIFENLTDRNIPVVTLQRVGLAPTGPTVIVLHGLYSHKEEYLEELYELGRRGFRAVAIDLALHGARQSGAFVQELFAADYIGSLHALIYDTVADISALLDHWDSSDTSVGVFAISAGGLVAHAAAVSEPRIGALAAIITSPDWLTADPSMKLEPGSPLEAMLRQLSPSNSPAQYPPKALLMLVGADDDVVSPVGASALYQSLVPIYNDLGIDDRLELKIFPGIGHSYTPEMRKLSLDWLSKHLLKDVP